MVLSLADTLRKLRTYTNVSFPIISAYIPVGRDHTPETLAQKLQELTEESFREDEREASSEDLLYMESYLKVHGNELQKGTFAFFSGGDALWEAIKLPVLLPISLKRAYSVYLDPLLAYVEQFSRFLVVVVDRQRTTLFTLYLGELEEHKTLRQDKTVPQQFKGRNAPERAAKVDRHILDHLHRHFQNVVTQLQAFIQDKTIAGIIIGGHSEVIGKFEEELPVDLRKKVIGIFHQEPKEDINGLIQEAKNILAQKGQLEYQHEQFFLPR